MALHCGQAYSAFAGGENASLHAWRAIERCRDFGALRHFNPDLEAEPPAVALEIAARC